MCAGQVKRETLETSPGSLTIFWTGVAWVTVEELRTSYCKKETLEHVMYHIMATSIKVLNNNPVTNIRHYIIFSLKASTPEATRRSFLADMHLTMFQQLAHHYALVHRPTYGIKGLGVE